MGKWSSKFTIGKKLILLVAFAALGIVLITGLNNLAVNTQEEKAEQAAVTDELNTEPDAAKEKEPSEDLSTNVAESAEKDKTKKAKEDINEEVEKNTNQSEDQMESADTETQTELEQEKNIPDTPAEAPMPKEQKTAENPAIKNEPEKKKTDGAKEAKEEKEQPAEIQQSVLFTIVGSKDMGTILSTIEVEVKESDTVLDVLKRITKKSSIQMDYRGAGASAYVEGINNLYEFDRGPGSGWMYSINGKFPNKGAGNWPVKPDDHIQWLYTEDLGRDIGAGAEDGLWDGKE